MRKRTEKGTVVNIFNFSFLDILACTVGAIIFILVMVVLVNSYIASQSEMARRIQQLENKYAAKRKEGAEITRRKAEIQTETENLENALQLWRERANLINELTQKKQEVDKLQQQLKKLQQQTIQIWPPKEVDISLLPEPKKPTIPLVFENRTISPIEEPFFRIVTNKDGDTEAERLKNGETFETALLPRSATSGMLSLYTYKGNFVPMVVYPSGFASFRKFRDLLIEKDWDYSLTLLPEDAKVKFGGGTTSLLR